jgi:hypothetical protein
VLCASCVGLMMLIYNDAAAEASDLTASGPNRTF